MSKVVCFFRCFLKPQLPKANVYKRTISISLNYFSEVDCLCLSGRQVPFFSSHPAPSRLWSERTGKEHEATFQKQWGEEQSEEGLKRAPVKIWRRQELAAAASDVLVMLNRRGSWKSGEIWQCRRKAFVFRCCAVNTPAAFLAGSSIWLSSNPISKVCRPQTPGHVVFEADEDRKLGFYMWVALEQKAKNSCMGQKL